jgi:hypothetical protein
MAPPRRGTPRLGTRLDMVWEPSAFVSIDCQWVLQYSRHDNPGERLQPWRQNVGKRLVKSPKVYLADSGILHQLLNLPTPREVEGQDSFPLRENVRAVAAARLLSELKPLRR